MRQNVPAAAYDAAMKHTIIIAVGLLVACGDADASGGSSSGGSSSGGADPSNGGAASAGGENPGGGGQGGGAGANAPSLPTCIGICDTAQDCATASPITDADNWACDGACEYLGCLSDAECQMAYANPNYACASLGGVDTCVQVCDVVEDCFLPSPLYDGGNWACESQRCEYLGCTSDEECQEGLQTPNYACLDVGGTPTCQRTCESPADCLTPTPLYDADNWACEEGLCAFQGCNSTEECVQTLMNPNYVCQE